MPHPDIPAVFVDELLNVAQVIARVYQRPYLTKEIHKVVLDSLKFSGKKLFYPNSKYVRFLEQCSRETGDHLLGAVIGSHIPFKSIGPFGSYVASAPTLREAIDRATRTIKYHETGSNLVLRKTGPQLSVHYSPPTPIALGTKHQCDGAAALMISLVREYAGPEWTPQSIGLVLATGKRAQALEGFFGAPVFEVPSGMEIYLQDGLLSSVSLTQEVNDSTSSCDLRELMLAPPPQTFAEAFYDALFFFMISGTRNVSAIAPELGMTPRTLQRKLESNNASFQDMKKQISSQIALAKFREGAQVGEVSELLGYSSLSHFSRSFKAMHGISPREFRKSLGSKLR